MQFNAQDYALLVGIKLSLLNKNVTVGIGFLQITELAQPQQSRQMKVLRAEGHSESGGHLHVCVIVPVSMCMWAGAGVGVCHSVGVGMGVGVCCCVCVSVSVCDRL